MEEDFRNLVAGEMNFANITLELFSLLPERDTNVFFADINPLTVKADFKCKVMCLRRKYRAESKCLVLWLFDILHFFLVGLDPEYFTDWHLDNTDVPTIGAVFSKLSDSTLSNLLLSYFSLCSAVFDLPLLKLCV